MFGRNNQKKEKPEEERKESRKERKEREKVEKEAAIQQHERFELIEQSWKIGVEYMGGHKLFPKKKRTVLHVEKDSIIIEDLNNLSIPYSQIKNLENMDEQRITKTRIVLLGVWGLLWKKKFLYTVIDFNDGLMDQSIILDCDREAAAVQRFIYARMLEAKQNMKQEA